MQLAKLKKEDPKKFEELEKEYQLVNTMSFISKYGGSRATYLSHFGKKKINFIGHFKHTKTPISKDEIKKKERKKKYQKLVIEYNTVINFYIKDVHDTKAKSIIGFGKIEKNETTLFIYKDVKGFTKLNDELSYARFKAKDLVEVTRMLKAYNVDKSYQVRLMRLT